MTVTKRHAHTLNY